MNDTTNGDDELPEPSSGGPSSGGTPPPPQGIAYISIEAELKRSYLDYAMSVIVSRALPDARDGLKPVHRRIIYAMHEEGRTSDKKYVKSANIVGDVMGRYHPHGDSAIYDALVRMAQPFSMSLLLVDGQGNFGSVDGDPPAAMRYTESRMTKAAEALVADIEKQTIDFTDNYDGSRREPSVLPSRIPNLLVNGAGGIAVGMATNIPPHNLGEIVDACLAVLDDPSVSMEDLLSIVPGPDYPTGGEILGRSGARLALMTGRGSVVTRGKASIETIRKDREAIVITEIPYQVNKSSMIEHIAELVRDKRIEGISDVRDESDRQGMRVVVELKRDASGDVILNQLYRFTSLQTSFGVNMLALDHGRPQQMGLRRLLDIFLDFREDVVVRRIRFELNKARDRGHVLVGMTIAVANIDEVIHIIRSSADPSEARERLCAKTWPSGDMAPLIDLIADPRSIVLEGAQVRLTDEQARAILALTLSRLTGLGRDEIGDEARALSSAIAGYLEILSSRERIMAIVREELVEVKAQFAVPRRTQIAESEGDIEDEDLIPREDMVVTVTHSGYVKRTPLSMYREQHRGGKGRSGMAMKDEDAIIGVYTASTHQPMLFFSSTGKAFKLKVWRLPVGNPQSKGKAFVNLLPIEPGDNISNILALPEEEAGWDKLDIIFATRSGDIRRNKLSDFVNVNRAGKIAMKLEEGDAIVGVAVCSDDQDVLLSTSGGRAIRFAVDEVRVFKGRDSTGVRGVRLLGDDKVISMAILKRSDAIAAERAAYLKRASAERTALIGSADDEAPAVVEDDSEETSDIAELTDERYAELKNQEEFILTISDVGFGKRSSSFEFRRTGRGGQGIVAMDMSKRGGKLAACFPIEATDGILLVTQGGQLIRTSVRQVRIAGRNTQGVTIFRTAGGERVVSVERLPDSGEDEAGTDEAPAISNET
ncbi:DNA gyrase, A subunit [Asticcacaulis biprosthecium C19]|uniref:DNA gyrase subunit A n=1 Tax=Asticcacaulis biprosthecium C19 TaxID=715226 RepID=F4QR89_9CAUL|nr:DNA gyrase subunit A [Asticcacaulis biprosthecium]EGF90726.1 DNA gyrase, A subunit [Asticcacaulis biprosthecium C19]